MAELKTIFFALWDLNFEVLNNPHLMGLIYTILIITLILENGFLPAAFLPGDSFLFLTGVVITQSEMNYALTLLLLTLASSFGCWLGYLQGRWLSHTAFMQRWLSHLPPQYYQRTVTLLHKYDILALVIARFTAFVRTIMPLLIGMSSMEHRRFQLVNVVSGFIWVFVLVNLGMLLGRSPFFLHHKETVMMLLTLIPIGLILIGLLTSMYWVLKRKKNEAKK